MIFDCSLLTTAWLTSPRKASALYEERKHDTALKVKYAGLWKRVYHFDGDDFIWVNKRKLVIPSDVLEYLYTTCDGRAGPTTVREYYEKG